MTAEERRPAHLRAVTDPAPHAHAEQAPDPGRLLDYDEEFLACRDVQHTWPPRKVWRWKQLTNETGRTVAYSRSMMCARCHTIARDVIDAYTGESRQTYHWPAGYSMPKGQGVTKRDVRVEQVRRVAASFAAGDLEDDEIGKDERAQAQAPAGRRRARRIDNVG